MKLYYHTRHIPEEHLNMNEEVGRTVKENGLCDVLDSPISEKMREYNIDVIETRVVWYEVEKIKGRLNFDRLKRDIEKIKNQGFGVGVFPWFQHPPEWVEYRTRLRCLEHDKESTLISLWDPELLNIYDRLYGALAKKFGEDIDFLYVGVYGDFGEVFYPHGVKHYIFSPPHGHPGLYCGDGLARNSWRNYLEEKYKTLDNLNKAWEGSEKSFNNDLMKFSMRDNINKRLDFAEWYTGSLMDFLDKVCAIVRKYFPHTRAALPIGQRREPLEFGQVKSVVAKIAAKYNMSVRWTSVADFGCNFAYSNICSRRLSSAAKFYGAGYGVEASLYLDKNTAPAVIYETLANNAEILHNDPGNIIRAGDIYEKFRSMDEPEGFVCDLAVFYPLEAELCARYNKAEYEYRSSKLENPSYDDLDILQCEMSDIINMNEYYGHLAKLRRYTDYDIIDSVMIEDGVLNLYDKIFLPAGCILTKRTVELLTGYSNNGGTVFYERKNPPSVLENKAEFTAGKPIDDYNVFGHNDDWFYTRHKNKKSRFNNESGEIEFI